MRNAWRYLGLLAIAALAVGVFAGPASAKKLSAKQKAQVRSQLRKQIKKNPKLINKRAFIKRASLVNFRLPITVALRSGDIPATAANEAATRNTNRATLDLGASLGQREVNLGGKLAGEIIFADSYDGGALGNVRVELNPGPKSLTTTSIPLLWNTRVSSAAGTRWDASALIDSPAFVAATGDAFRTTLEAQRGCGNFDTTTATGPYGSYLTFGAPYLTGPLGPGSGLPGFPMYSAANPNAAVPGATPDAFIGQRVGVDATDNLKANKDTGNPNSLGGNISPFPSGANAPGGFSQPPSVEDTVLRTAPLTLQIAQPGTQVNGSTNTNDGTAGQNGVSGAENITLGKSGGNANLFGNIPGKSYGIDVTVNLATRINSILRIVEQDSWGRNLIEGEPWPAGVFECRQVYSGAVQNYIPSVRLQGTLRIAPGITSDGSLRIAKAKLQSGTEERPHFQVAACLVPYASFNAPTANYAAPMPAATPATPFGQIAEAGLPVDLDNIRPVPEAANCNEDPTALVKNSALAPQTVDQIAPAVPANGYSSTASGSAVSVAADLNVNNVDADILIGDA